MPWTTEQLSSFLLFTDNQDMEAINRFMSDTVAVTPEGVKLKDAWIKWWDNLGWWEKSIETGPFDEARNRRNAFIRANAATAAEKEAVERVIRTGVTTEEMSPDDFWRLDPGNSGGQTKRTDSEGNLPEPPPAPLVPTWVKTGGIVALLAGVALGVSKIVARLNPVGLIAGIAAKKGK